MQVGIHETCSCSLFMHFFVKHRAGCRWNADGVLIDSAVQPVTGYWMVVWKTSSLLRFVYPGLTVINCDVLHLFTHISPLANKILSFFMPDCPWILDKQIKARQTRCNKWWFIGNQLFLNMFRASLRPSSGEQTAFDCIWFHVQAMVVVVPESRVAWCVHCAEDVAWLSDVIKIPWAILCWKEWL